MMFDITHVQNQNYQREQADEWLENDGISTEEAAFLEGYLQTE